MGEALLQLTRLVERVSNETYLWLMLLSVAFVIHLFLWHRPKKK